MKFKGIGFKNGKQEEINIEAKSKDLAFTKMKNSGYTNISIVEKASMFSRHSVKIKELCIIFQQLAAFSETGEDFPKSLGNIADVATNQTLKEALLDIKRRIERGETIPTAFGSQKMFPPIVVNLLKVGDSSGEMTHTLNELAKYLQQMYTMQQGTNSAVMYPKIILTVMVIAMAFIVAKVLPQFRAFYSDMQIEMPMITKILYAFSDFINNDWMIVVPGILALVYFLQHTQKYIPDLHDSLVIKMPLIKGIMLNLYMFRFCKTLEILSGAGVEITQSLKLTADTMENHLYSDILLKTIPMVKAGEGITSAIRRNDTDKIFDNMTIAFLSTGEDTDEMPKMLSKASEYYQKNLNTEIDAFGKKIEPILLIVIAVFVFFLVASVYLPIFRMSQISGQTR